MSRGSVALPFVDEHAITIAAPLTVVWAALGHYATTALRLGRGNPLVTLLLLQRQLRLVSHYWPPFEVPHKASRATRKPMLPVELSTVLELRAATRKRLQ